MLIKRKNFICIDNFINLVSVYAFCFDHSIMKVLLFCRFAHREAHNSPSLRNAKRLREVCHSDRTDAHCCVSHALRHQDDCFDDDSTVDWRVNVLSSLVLHEYEQNRCIACYAVFNAELVSSCDEVLCRMFRECSECLFLDLLLQILSPDDVDIDAIRNYISKKSKTF